jgi:hypothetical protein
MTMTRFILAPIRSVLRSPLLHFAVVVTLILFLEAAPDQSAFGQISKALDTLVDSTVELVSRVLTPKTFTRSLILAAIAMVYVYLCFIAVVYVLRFAIRRLVDLAGRKNLLWLRTVIARERGIAAYRAWLPLERIRPNHIPQAEWEATFAWPPDNSAPYPSLPVRIGRAIGLNAALIAAVVIAIFVYRWTQS